MNVGKESGFVLDSNKVKLSIIIPVYNTEKYLRKCLNSVVAAVDGIEKVVEVLIINDGSPDNSELIITEFCGKYKWMHSFKKDNGGLSDVKNFGLMRAKGTYVIFLDSDDYVEPGMYRDMLEQGEKEEADIIICDIKLVYDDPSKNTVWPCAISSREGTFAQVMDMSMMPASWNKMVKRNLYAGLEFPVGLNNEDVAVTPIVLARAKTIITIDKPFYNYYQRTGSIQNSSFNEKRFVILQTTKLCMDRLMEVEADKAEIIKGSLYLHQVLSMAFYPIRYEAFERRYKLLKLYMTQVEILFPDIWDNYEIKEFQTWETIHMQMYRKISCQLLKRKCYYLTCIFWSIYAVCKEKYIWFRKNIK